MTKIEFESRYESLPRFRWHDIVAMVAFFVCMSRSEDQNKEQEQGITAHHFAPHLRASRRTLPFSGAASGIVGNHEKLASRPPLNGLLGSGS